MAVIKRILVGDRERVLLIRKGRFDRVLGPGEYWIWTFGRKVEAITFKINDLTFENDWADYLVKEQPALAAELFTVVETGDAQVAVVYLNGKLARVLGPGKRLLYWRGPVEVAAEVIDVAVERQLPAKLATAVTRLTGVMPVVYALVDEGKTGLLFVDGRYVRSLASGSYAFWNLAWK